jgi:hypothetical protein
MSLSGTTSSDAASMTTSPPSPRIRLRASSSTSGDDNPSILRLLETILLGSVVLPTTDVMRGPSILLYAPSAPLQLPADELVAVSAAVFFVVLIRSLDLDVIWSSLEVLSISLAA